MIATGICLYSIFMFQSFSHVRNLPNDHVSLLSSSEPLEHRIITKSIRSRPQSWNYHLLSPYNIRQNQTTLRTSIPVSIALSSNDCPFHRIRIRASTCRVCSGFIISGRGTISKDFGLSHDCWLPTEKKNTFNVRHDKSSNILDLQC